MIEKDEAFADLSRRKLDLLEIPRERRRDRRLRLTTPLPARLGSADCLLIDLGARGARLQHSKPVKLAREAHLSFRWPDGPFDAPVRILSSRLIAAGLKPKFESRVQFLVVAPEAKNLLDRVIRTLTDRQLRQWVANFMGEIVYRVNEEPDGSRALLRFRFVDGRWTGGPAREDEPPPLDGFIVPASIEPGEINILCSAYSRLDRDGRQLLRLFASAALAA